MALAPLGHVLFSRVMRYDPSDTAWFDRDRFVLSNGHASILQYALLYLSGCGLEMDDLRAFRQWESRTPGHPERRHTPGVEVTTGPLGQGLGDSVGLAIAERELRARFGADVQDHHTFVIAGDGCLQEGISHEAASLAGHLGLGRLILVYDDNHITIDGDTTLSSSDDAARALPGLRLARRGARRDRQRLRRAGGGDPVGHGGRGPAVVPAPAQPHRLPVAGPHRRPRGARAGLRRSRRQPHQGRDGYPGRTLLGAVRGGRGLPGTHRGQGRGRSARPGTSGWPSGMATGRPGTRRGPARACRAGPTRSPVSSRREAGHPPGPAEGAHRQRRVRTRSRSSGRPTSPATPARRSTARSGSRPTIRAAGRCTTASASTRWVRAWWVWPATAGSCPSAGRSSSSATTPARACASRP